MLLAVRVIIAGKLPSPAPVRVQLRLKVTGGMGRPDPASVDRGAERSRTLRSPRVARRPQHTRMSPPEPDGPDEPDENPENPDGQTGRTDATTKERPSRPRPRPVCTGWGSCSVQSVAAVDFSGSVTNQR